MVSPHVNANHQCDDDSVIAGLDEPRILVPAEARENLVGRKAGHVNQEMQARADRDFAAADRCGNTG